MQNKFSYVDAFVIPVQKKHLPAYKKIAKMMSKVTLDNGAISYVECMAHDAPTGKTTSFPQSVKLKKGEVVFFSWITYKSLAHRNSVMKKVMADPRMDLMGKGPMPFDGARMFWGGFKPVVKA